MLKQNVIQNIEWLGKALGARTTMQYDGYIRKIYIDLGLFYIEFKEQGEYFFTYLFDKVNDKAWFETVSMTKHDLDIEHDIESLTQVLKVYNQY